MTVVLTKAVIARDRKGNVSRGGSSSSGSRVQEVAAVVVDSLNLFVRLLRVSVAMVGIWRPRGGCGLGFRASAADARV